MEGISIFLPLWHLECPPGHSAHPHPSKLTSIAVQCSSNETTLQKKLIYRQYQNCNHDGWKYVPSDQFFCLIFYLKKNLCQATSPETIPSECLFSAVNLGGRSLWNGILFLGTFREYSHSEGSDNNPNLSGSRLSNGQTMFLVNIPFFSRQEIRYFDPERLTEDVLHRMIFAVSTSPHLDLEKRAQILL
ncbi:hypothetical protein TNCV_1213921 [Trichonephila clavipes]|nr:hypothetical protein TNCV_1213921 [Trichonephila clavipes]